MSKDETLQRLIRELERTLPDHPALEVLRGNAVALSKRDAATLQAYAVKIVPEEWRFHRDLPYDQLLEFQKILHRLLPLDAVITDI